MKKVMGLFLAAVMGLAVLAQADTATVTLTATNGQAIQYSGQIPASGYLDKIEIVQSAGSTATVTIATYSGTTAVDTFASLTAAGGVAVIRTRRVGTSVAGVAITGVPVDTNAATTVLSAPYERPLIGGNVLMAVTPTTGAAATNTVTATIYYQRLDR